MKLSKIATEKEKGRRLDRVLKSLFMLSARRMTLLKKSDSIFVNDIPTHVDYRVQTDDLIECVFPDDLPLCEDASSKLDIAYEDDALLIVNKPSPMPTMSSPYQDQISLEKLVMDYLGTFRPVNRLDKGTSGLMVIAKTAYVQSCLQSMLHSDDFIREYVCVADGILDDNEGVIDRPISEPPEGSVKRTVSDDGRPSVTEYRVLRRGDDKTLIRLRLKTGRTHQIRVHLSSIGHPVTGDYLYGAARDDMPDKFVLHSTYIRLIHPLTKEIIEIDTGCPEAFIALL